MKYQNATMLTNCNLSCGSRSSWTGCEVGSRGLAGTSPWGPPNPKGTPLPSRIRLVCGLSKPRQSGFQAEEQGGALAWASELLLGLGTKGMVMIKYSLWKPTYGTHYPPSCQSRHTQPISLCYSFCPKIFPTLNSACLSASSCESPAHMPLPPRRPPQFLPSFPTNPPGIDCTSLNT